MNVGGFAISFGELATLLAVLGTLGGQIQSRFAGRAKAKAIETIEHEVKPNSGKSLRDAVDRIEAKVGTLADRVDVLEGRPCRPFWRR